MNVSMHVSQKTYKVSKIYNKMHEKVYKNVKIFESMMLNKTLKNNPCKTLRNNINTNENHAKVMYNFK